MNNNKKNINKILKKITKIYFPKYIKKNINNYNINKYKNIFTSKSKKKKKSIILPYENLNISKNIYLKIKNKNIKTSKITSIIKKNYFKEKNNKKKIIKYDNCLEEYIFYKKTFKKIIKTIKKKKKICSIGVNLLKIIEHSIINNKLSSNYNNN